MGVKIGSNAAKRNRNTHLSAIMCVRLLQKLGVHNLTNRTQFKKITAIKNVRKVCVIAAEFV